METMERIVVATAASLKLVVREDVAPVVVAVRARGEVAQEIQEAGWTRSAKQMEVVAAREVASEDCNQHVCATQWS